MLEVWYVVNRFLELDPVSVEEAVRSSRPSFLSGSPLFKRVVICDFAPNNK